MNGNDEKSVEGVSRYLQAMPPSIPEALSRMVAGMLSAQMASETLHGWFTELGHQWAAQIHPQLTEVDSLEKLGECINAYWSQQQWGWIELTELPDRVLIRHRAFPLARLFGEEQLSWSVGLLEGFYRRVFQQLGAEGDLQLRATHYSQDGFDLHLELTS